MHGSCRCSVAEGRAGRRPAAARGHVRPWGGTAARGSTVPGRGGACPRRPCAGCSLVLLSGSDADVKEALVLRVGQAGLAEGVAEGIAVLGGEAEV